jgi:S-adenosylmethionine hydrolase
MPAFITFTSDFSLLDDSVGTVKGVMWRIAPQAVIIDILHAVPDYDVLRGALCLENTLPYMPVGAHLAVVDPGVGTARRPVVLTTGRGDYLVGPDNGLLPPAADALGGIAAAHLLANEAYMLSPRSATFHGRDIFGPAAAHLAAGATPAALGPAIDPHTLVRLPVVTPEWREGRLQTEVLYIDHYGNLRLGARVADLRAGGLQPGDRIITRVGVHEVVCPWRETFGAIAEGCPVLVEDSYWRLCLALNRASAAHAYGAGVGTPVTLSAT